MPNNRRSKVQRLPKGERRHASPKIVILNPATGAVHAPSCHPAQGISSNPRRINTSEKETMHASPSAEHENLEGVAITDTVSAQRRTSRIPQLDDESLAKLLHCAGHPAIVTALRVCVQWRRVAQQILECITRVDLFKMYVNETGGRKSPPTYAHVIRTVNQFPNLATLVVRNWMYQDVMEDVVTNLCANLNCHTLRKVEFTGVFVRPGDLAVLVKRFRNVKDLRLEGHVSVDDELLTGFAAAYKASGFGEEMGPQTITLAKCPCVDQDGVKSILTNVMPSALIVTGCSRLQHLDWTSTRSVPMEKLTITNCNNFKFCTIQIPDGKKFVYDLNFSQCHKLRTVAILSSGNTAFEPGLRKLNLSGCRLLSNLLMQHNSETWSLKNLEDLALFGVVSLRPRRFSNSFGFDANECALPNLRRLILNGCKLQTLKLIGFSNLGMVNVSGCPELAEVEVRDCWQMEHFEISGRLAPLRSVNMVLPVSCRVPGRRSEWHWECYGSNQSILYP